MYDDLYRFEHDQLDRTGRYIGIDWAKTFKDADWPYRPGNFIPTDKRESARLSWNWHCHAAQMANQ